MGLPVTAKIANDPILKKFSKDEIRKLMKTPQARELVEKLSLKHDLPKTEIVKALLGVIENEAKEMKGMKPG